VSSPPIKVSSPFPPTKVSSPIPPSNILLLSSPEILSSPEPPITFSIFLIVSSA
jgi:hypothetical protein